VSIVRASSDDDSMIDFLIDLARRRISPTMKKKTADNATISKSHPSEKRTGRRRRHRSSIVSGSSRISVLIDPAFQTTLTPGDLRLPVGAHLIDMSPEYSPQAARLEPRLKALAARGINFGTSSWKYDGWLGSIYSEHRYIRRGKLSKANFEQNCLEEYAQILPTVCGDLTSYQFPTDQYWAKLFNATPKHFIFGFKVPVVGQFELTHYPAETSAMNPATKRWISAGGRL
jgi:hypothetical protein